MARVRWERMNHYRNQSTYRAIEADHARADMAAQEQAVDPAPVVEPADERNPIEMARAANAALKGA